ncbi:programmed cell death 1 ligand 1-like [Aulostomus maculatus]
MDWLLTIFVLQVLLQPCLSDLFIVEAEQTMYRSEFRGEVVMGCRFQPVLSTPDPSFSITWHWVTPSLVREVYRMDNLEERLGSQHPDFKGRVRTLTEELKGGWARLQVSNLRMTDSGTYQCLMQSEKGADYKDMTLSVSAPYKKVDKHIKRVTEDEVLLTCQSEGYPASPVVWRNGTSTYADLNSSTTSVSTPDQLFRVTSQIRVSASAQNNYSCSFTDGGLSATFHIPDEIPQPHAKHEALIIAFSTAPIPVVILAVVACYQRRKVRANL